jgi:hypothetical protein
MDSKNKIREILRENIFDKIKEATPTPQPDAKKKPAAHQTDYSEIQRKLDSTMLKASQVMAAAGLGDPDNATDRSLFSKKLRMAKNDEGGVYRFDDIELAKIYKVVNNPTGYLNAKSK